MHDFTLLITEWYRQNARTLPWRNTSNPYFIWLSEVILQQTRVDQGTNYYKKFIKNFPTIQDLAESSEEEVLKNWQGLGYYSRARNLHHAAKEIVSRHNGLFPNSYEAIRQLKGVGDYTAAAIASFAFGLPHAVVDGNVYRLLSRYFGEETPIDSTQGKKLFKALAQEFLPDNDPATYNQALMEMGALICTPKKPNCENCPLQASCLGLRAGKRETLPIKAKKTKTRNRYFNYIVASNPDTVLIQQRPENDIWAKMYEPPMIETPVEIDFSALLEQLPQILKGQLLQEPIATYKHILSHQHIYAKFWKINNPMLVSNTAITIVTPQRLKELPIPRLFDRFLNDQ
jgi:A/G-specific adenine glycosylase